MTLDVGSLIVIIIGGVVAVLSIATIVFNIQEIINKKEEE